MGFYLQYLATWPEYFLVEEAPHNTGRLSCYSALWLAQVAAWGAPCALLGWTGLI